MKRKDILYLIIYGVVGYFVFNLIVSLIEVILLKFWHIKNNFSHILFDNIYVNLVIYLIIFFITMFIIFLHNKYIVKILNDKLQKIKKKGGDNDE